MTVPLVARRESGLTEIGKRLGAAGRLAGRPAELRQLLGLEHAGGRQHLRRGRSLCTRAPTSCSLLFGTLGASRVANGGRLWSYGNLWSAFERIADERLLTHFT
jgi:hypothetical protein